MSPLVTRPSLPVPVTLAGLSPVSSEMRRTDGITGASASSAGSSVAAPGLGGRRVALAALGGGGHGFAGCTSGFDDVTAVAPALPSAMAPRMRADLHCGAGLDGNGFNRAVGGRGHFDRHLVGFEFEQRLVARDRFALFLEPARNRGFGHGLAHRGNFDFDAHAKSPRGTALL